LRLPNSSRLGSVTQGQGHIVVSTIPPRLLAIKASMSHTTGPEHPPIEHGAERIINPELIELQISAKDEYAQPA
jgi:hypothetical protein